MWIDTQLSMSTHPLTCFGFTPFLPVPARAMPASRGTQDKAAQFLRTNYKAPIFLNERAP
jgi:hypothetical protein